MFEKIQLIEQQIYDRLDASFMEETTPPEIKIAGGESWESVIRTLSPAGRITISYTGGNVDDRNRVADRTKHSFIITAVHRTERDNLFDWLQRIEQQLNRWKPPAASTPLLYMMDKIAPRVQESESHIAEVLYQCTIM